MLLERPSSRCLVRRCGGYAVALFAVVLLAGCSQREWTPLERAGELLRQDQFAAAIVACDEHLGAEPGDHEGLFLRGKIHLAAGDYTAAIADLTAAYEAKPTDPLPLFSRAVAYERSHQPARASDDMELARTLDPRSVAYDAQVRDQVRKSLPAAQHQNPPATKPAAPAPESSPVAALPPLENPLAAAAGPRVDLEAKLPTNADLGGSLLDQPLVLAPADHPSKQTEDRLHSVPQVDDSVSNSKTPYVANVPNHLRSTVLPSNPHLPNPQGLPVEPRLQLPGLVPGESLPETTPAKTPFAGTQHAGPANAVDLIKQEGTLQTPKAGSSSGSYTPPGSKPRIKRAPAVVPRTKAEPHSSHEPLPGEQSKYPVAKWDHPQPPAGKHAPAAPAAEEEQPLPFPLQLRQAAIAGMIAELQKETTPGATRKYPVVRWSAPAVQQINDTTAARAKVQQQLRESEPNTFGRQPSRSSYGPPLPRITPPAITIPPLPTATSLRAASLSTFGLSTSGLST